MPHRAGAWSTQGSARISRRRLIVVVALAVVMVGAVGTAVGMVVYAQTYQPLGQGSLGSNAGLNAKAVTDGIDDTRLIVIGPAGTRARVEVSLDNDGSHDVRLLGLPANSGIDRLAWGPGVDSSRRLGGTPAEARPFPVTLHAHEEISLWIYLTQPHCAAAHYTLNAVPLRWSAFGVHHVYSLPLDHNFLPITLCPPQSALRHIDRFS